MQNFLNAPHVGGSPVHGASPNAALLIDFDNVTMGIRSDLTRQLKELLNSDIIKGKVAVQRAYADWRRYAQYIVPLSEASVDLIFAPAYGSSKKNATDIRLAIDALELVFTRPEIGTFILLSGDSDFSSLVLKLKEYGKYVIGVGLRESASDLLVQNCDEYFSYSSLTGLTKAGEEDTVSEVDPWDLAEKAIRQMATANDVMRSDRLKQVMLEMDPSFDESKIGFSKFNKFLVEAASRNRVDLKKLDNGQYEVQPFENGGDSRDDRRRGRGGRSRRDEPRSQRPEPRQPQPVPQREPSRSERSDRAERPAATTEPSGRERRAETLEQSYELLQQAVRNLIDQSGGAARDSDIKRQMLELQPGWDEAELGFTKFSRFLRQAHAAEVVDLSRSGEGYYEARLRGGAGQRKESQRSDRGRRESAAPQARESARPSRTEREPESRRGEEPKRREEPRSEPARQTVPDREERPSRERPSQQEAPATQATETAAAGPTGEAGEARKQEDAKAPAEQVATDRAANDKETTDKEAREAAAPKAEPEKKAAQATQAGPTSRSVGGRRGRKGATDGPPPLLPGQVVGGGAGDAAPAAEKPTSTPSKPAEEPVKKPAAESAATARQPTAQPAEPAPETPAKQTAPTGSATELRESRPSQGRSAEPKPETQETPAAATAGPSVGGGPAEPAPGAAPAFDAEEIGLPTEAGAVVRYLSNSYQGVGQKTAEALIETFGAEGVFNGLHSQPGRVKEVLGSGRRTEALLDAWQRDYRRRTTAGAAGSSGAGES